MNGFRIMHAKAGLYRVSNLSYRNKVGLIVGSTVLIVTLLLLYPIFAIAPSHSHRNPCLGNLKQLSLGVILYSADNSDCLPRNYTFDGEISSQKFFDVVRVYTKNESIQFCPEDKGQERAGTFDPGREGVPGLNSYVHPLSFRGRIPEYSVGKRVVNLSKIDAPANTPYLRDPIRGTKVVDGKTSVKSPHDNFPVAYLDGHAKSEKDIVAKGAL